MLAQGVRRRTHCALRAPFKQLRQVSARSACVLRHTHAPPALRFSARAEGNPRDIHSGHCFATLRSAPSRGRKRHTLRKLGLAQRWPVWLFGCWMFGCPPPAGCACGGAVAGWHGRRSAHASCSDSPWMSERRARAQSEFHGAPRNRPAAGLPLRTAKGSQTGGRLSFGYFSLAKQRKVPRPPGRLPASALNPGTRPHQPKDLEPGKRSPKDYQNNSYQRISH